MEHTTIQGRATAVVLAAGMGTRMRSNLPKAMHPLGGRPMISHLLDACDSVFAETVVVVGPGMEALSALVSPRVCAVQADRLGTAHAALQAQANFGHGDVAVLYADNPLVSPQTLRKLLDRRSQGDAGLVLLAMRPADPGRYGRVIHDGGYVSRIVEWADASPDERAVGLCNAGVICASAPDMLRWLRAVGNENVKGEYYLTDVVAIAASEGARVAAVEGPEAELRGVNSPEELQDAEMALRI